MAGKQTSLKILSFEYIRGLTDGEGCFTFYPANFKNKSGDIVKKKLPAYVIRMHVRDKNLIESIKYTLKLRTKVNVFKAWKGDGYNRGDQAALIVRGIGELKNIIVPLFYKKLIGFKALQFEQWIEKIGSDPVVANNYRLIYRLYKCGYWDKNPKFI